MKKTLFYLCSFALSLASCATTNNRFLQADVIGFSEKAETSFLCYRGPYNASRNQSQPFDLMMGTNSIKTYIQQDGNIPRGQNTCIYYSMDLALDRITYVRKHFAKNDVNTKYYIFLLTDGLDNNSPAVAKEDKRIPMGIKADEYPNRITKRIRKVMGNKKNRFEVYPMLLEGEDIRQMRAENTDFDSYLERKLGCLCYSSTGKTPKLIHEDEYSKIFRELRKQFVSSSYEFLIPKSYEGKKIRMTLQRRSEGGKVLDEKAVVEGVLSKNGLGYVLEDLSLNGLEFKDANIPGARECATRLISNTSTRKGSNVLFRIDQITKDNMPFFVNSKTVRQEFNDGGIWITNTEYKEQEDVNVDTYFLLVLDGSTSLDGKQGKDARFKDELRMAENIIDMVSVKKK